LLPLLDEEEEDCGVKALATAKVVSVFPPKPPPPWLEPAPRASSVLAGELPMEVMTAASVVETCELSSIATAASGFTFPLATPESSTTFFKELSLLWES